MNRKPSRESSASLIEPLENRSLLSISPLHPAAAATPKTVTTLAISPHASIYGTNITVTATVKATPAKGNTPTGTVEFLDGGSAIPIDSNGDPLTLALGANGKISYTFGVGDLTLLPGKNPISAQFVTSNSLPGSTSRTTNLTIKAPKFTMTSDGLGIATVKKGTGKTGIAAGQTASMIYTGLLASNGQIFDYSNAHGSSSGPFQFTVEANPEQVISGFDEGTVGMKVGETRVLEIPSALGYGAEGSGTTIPANADLIFAITLESIS